MSRWMRSDRITWANEVVPLSQRLTYFDLFRGTAALIVAAGALFFDGAGTTGPGVLLATLLYVAITIAGGAMWRMLQRRSLTLFGALIIIDGIYLAWVSYASGGAESPYRYLILLHLITVTLLASYRTGLKMALWHSLLLLTTFHLSREGMLPATGTSESADVAGTVAFMVMFWLAAFLTATLAAVNERELRRRKVDVEALAAMATELGTTNDPTALAAVLASNLKRHFGARRVVVFRAHDRRLQPWAFEGEPKGTDRAVRPRDASVLIEVLRQRGTALVGRLDPETDQGLSELIPDAHNLVVMPLEAESGMIGVVVVEYGDKAPPRIARRAVDILERFTSHGGLALSNAMLVEKMEILASVDPLTGIANRRTFDTVLERRIRTASRHERPVSLILADIDHFKTLNDTNGHRVGDQVLKAVSTVLAKHVRSIDTVARYGGEEFVVVLPSCGPDEAAARAEQLRTAVERDLKKYRLTLSFGVATYPLNALNSDKLIGAADTALYESKCGGRNRVTSFRTSNRSDAKQRRSRTRNRTVVEDVA